MGKDGGGAGATSNNVYIMDKKYAWVPARLIESSGDKATVSVPNYDDESKILSDGGKGAKSWSEEKVSLKHYPGKSLPMQNVDKSGQLTMVDDMVDLPFLHEAAILYNLKARHVLAKPYTRTGDIVIAVNPYQWLTHLYTEKEQMKYAQTLVWANSGGDDQRKKVEPHVYETSALSYKGLAVDNTNQSILVSGESGAGTFVLVCGAHSIASGDPVSTFFLTRALSLHRKNRNGQDLHESHGEFAKGSQKQQGGRNQPRRAACRRFQSTPRSVWKRQDSS
jgi:Myosin head (motor domain)